MACGLLVRQFERCESAESRINLLHGTPPRYCDVDETRDWSRLSKHENDQFSAWQRQYRKRNADAQEAIFYPQACTFLTFPQRGNALWFDHVLETMTTERSAVDDELMATHSFLVPFIL